MIISSCFTKLSAMRCIISVVTEIEKPPSFCLKNRRKKKKKLCQYSYFHFSFAHILPEIITFLMAWSVKTFLILKKKIMTFDFFLFTKTFLLFNL